MVPVSMILGRFDVSACLVSTEETLLTWQKVRTAYSYEQYALDKPRKDQKTNVNKLWGNSVEFTKEKEKYVQRAKDFLRTIVSGANERASSPTSTVNSSEMTSSPDLDNEDARVTLVLPCETSVRVSLSRAHSFISGIRLVRARNSSLNCSTFCSYVWARERLKAGRLSIFQWAARSAKGFILSLPLFLCAKLEKIDDRLFLRNSKMKEGREIASSSSHRSMKKT